MKPEFDQDGVTLWTGDSLRVLPLLPAGSVQTCVTSPPYWGLRDYGVDGQIGHEETPEGYVAALVRVFGEIRRVMRDDGTLWLNLGDCYASTAPGCGSEGVSRSSTLHGQVSENYRETLRKSVGQKRNTVAGTLKPKDLAGIPWRVAFALQADGWYLRCGAPWVKRACMPESITDRPSTALEYMFLLAKAERYLYDADAIRKSDGKPEGWQHIPESKGYNVGEDLTGGAPDMGGNRQTSAGLHRQKGGLYHPDGRNRRNTDWWFESVGALLNDWDMPVGFDVTPKPYPGAHFATFPPDLIEPCILAGSRPGDAVLDPFNGSGTTGAVCQKHGRRYIGIELNPDYIELSKQRFTQRVLFPPEVA